MDQRSIGDFSAVDNKGKDFPFAALAGKAILVVNTASKCGFTPQYAGLEALHKEYAARGLAIIGFPCDQFAHQEPGTDAEIASFCALNYGVSFPIMRKVEVNGPGQHPLFSWLKERSARVFQRISGTAVKWNFTKFLVYPDGKTVRRFSPATAPEALRPAIEGALGAGR